MRHQTGRYTVTGGFTEKSPFTTKQDLRDHYPFGLSAVPLEEVVRLHSSSGTTGTPTVILHTQHDLEEWANAVARCLYMVGLRKGDIFQNSSGYGMFTGGLGFQYGAERLGMLTVPAAAGNTKRRLSLSLTLVLLLFMPSRVMPAVV